MTRSVTADYVFVSREDLRRVLLWAGHNCGNAPNDVVGAIDRLGDRELATRGQESKCPECGISAGHGHLASCSRWRRWNDEWAKGVTESFVTGWKANEGNNE